MFDRSRCSTTNTNVAARVISAVNNATSSSRESSFLTPGLAGCQKAVARRRRMRGRAVTRSISFRLLPILTCLHWMLHIVNTRQLNTRTQCYRRSRLFRQAIMSYHAAGYSYVESLSAKLYSLVPWRGRRREEVVHVLRVLQYRP